MIFNGKEYEVVSINSEYAVLRSGKTIITVSVADLKQKPAESKKRKQPKGIPPV